MALKEEQCILLDTVSAEVTTRRFWFFATNAQKTKRFDLFKAQLEGNLKA